MVRFRIESFVWIHDADALSKMLDVEPDWYIAMGRPSYEIASRVIKRHTKGRYVADLISDERLATELSLEILEAQRGHETAQFVEYIAFRIVEIVYDEFVIESAHKRRRITPARREKLLAPYSVDGGVRGYPAWGEE